MCGSRLHFAPAPLCFPTTELHTSRWMLRNQLCVTFQRHPGIGGVRCRPPLETGLPCSNIGVRFEQNCAKPDPKQQRWFCACNERCRGLSLQSKGAFTCAGNGTGNVTRHLRAVHCECVFSSHSFWTSSSLDVPAGSHRIFLPPSFCGAYLNFSREKDSAIPFPRRP